MRGIIGKPQGVSNAANPANRAIHINENNPSLFNDMSWVSSALETSVLLIEPSTGALEIPFTLTDAMIDLVFGGRHTRSSHT